MSIIDGGPCDTMTAKMEWLTSTPSTSRVARDRLDGSLRFRERRFFQTKVAWLSRR